MKFSSQKGMSLVELVASVSISALLTMGVFAFASAFANAQYEYQSNVELTNDARLVLEKMVWGLNITGQAQRRGIAEAASGTITSPTQFDYTDKDGAAHSVRVNSGNIEYRYGGSAWRELLDANGAAAYNANNYTVSLEFSQPEVPDSVNVRVVVGKRILSRWFYGSAATQVFYRNA